MSRDRCGGWEGYLKKDIKTLIITGCIERKRILRK